MSEKKILTKHPQRKTGRSISREKYDQIRAGILGVLGRKELTHTELMHGPTRGSATVSTGTPTGTARR